MRTARRLARNLQLGETKEPQSLPLSVQRRLETARACELAITHRERSLRARKTAGRRGKGLSVASIKVAPFGLAPSARLASFESTTRVVKSHAGSSLAVSVRTQEHEGAGREHPGSVAGVDIEAGALIRRE